MIRFLCPVTQTFEIRGLGGNLLPAAFAPVRVDGPDGITLDAETSSLFTASGTSADLRYTVKSVLSDYRPDCLRAADASPPTASRSGPPQENYAMTAATTCWASTPTLGLRSTSTVSAG